MKVYGHFVILSGEGRKSLIVILLEKLKELFWEEAGAQRLYAILLAPVFLAFGIGGYFSLSVEPLWGLGFGALLFSVLGLVVLRSYWRIVCIAVFLVCLGYFTAQLRTIVVHTPILEKAMDFQEFEGTVAEIEVLEKGARLTLKDVVLDGVDRERTPRKIRVKLWDIGDVDLGHRVAGLASLNPPSAPVIPSGFDFQRYMYFRGIGAVGFMYRAPEIVRCVHGVEGGAFIEGVRNDIGARIDGALEPPYSGLARALMIGQRSSIAEEDMEAIRGAGLAHMLAISGLHVGLLSGVVFFALRFGMAMFPAFALRYPIKKYAAIGAMLAASCYMLVAGATIPTQRALISVVVIFIAVLLDRSPISLRVVAFAAFGVLLFFPESLMSASFQMSFAAVTALVAFYDWTRPIWSQWSRQAGILRKVCLYLVGVCVTSVVATLATAPLTLFHFQALPSYGLLANLICVPVLAFVVMPFSILAFLLMPFGLEWIALVPVQYGLDVILRLAHAVSGLDGAVVYISSFSLGALIFAVLGGLSLIVFRGRIRVIFTIVFVGLFLLNFQWKQYDVLVSSKVDLVAFRSHEPYLFVSDGRKEQFVRKQWERVLGYQGRKSVSFKKEDVILGDGYTLLCDDFACRYTFGDYRVSYLRRFDVDTFAQECQWAAVVISQDVYSHKCEAEFTMNRRDGKYHGVHAFQFRDGNIIRERSEDFRGDRPWVSRR